MDRFNEVMTLLNGIIWHEYVLYIVLGVGVLFTIWSGFCQYRALTHGVAVTRGKYDDPDDPGAINHFQALSAALSATVGLGNIGGVAIAIALGGPGAVFWMWMIGIVGIALKTTEVTLSMIYRNTDHPDNPHGGPMFVAAKAFDKLGLAAVGRIIGSIFVITLLCSTVTGGNMFQAWNVAEVTNAATGMPKILVGIILAVLVGIVIIGGVKRIGSVAGKLVPFMCLVYLLAALYVLFVKFDTIPEMFAMIIAHAFSPREAGGAFTGATLGVAFSWGLKRALFSSEAGQGSSPIAHSAAKTNEPVREAVVAGLEPFIDTIVVCTLTALVILASGAWNRGHEAPFAAAPEFVQVDGEWTIGQRVDDTPNGSAGTTALPAKTRDAVRVSGDWVAGQNIFLVVNTTTNNETQPVHLNGAVRLRPASDPTGAEDTLVADWETVESDTMPTLDEQQMGVYRSYVSASLTTHAFNLVQPGLGTWLILIASWLFAFSTQISWSYYGEQGTVFLFGERAVFVYKLIFCLLIIVSCLGFIETDTELDNFSTFGTGVMLWANIPIMLIFGATAMGAYHAYIGKLKRGEFHPHKARKLKDIVED